MQQVDVDLSGLRGLHLINEPSWWPLAYGWWIILGVLVLTVIIFWIIKRWWQSRPVIYAMNQIKQIQQKSSNDLESLHALSDLMKRVAIFKFGREIISPLTEEKWQNFIIKTVPNLFSKQQAKLIAFSPYLTELKAPVDRQEIINLVEQWIRKTLKNKNSLDNSEKKR